MAASSGVRCPTLLAASSTSLNNDATVPEESAARPRLLPARERKSRRVCTVEAKYEGRRKKGERDCGMRISGRGLQKENWWSIWRMNVKLLGAFFSQLLRAAKWQRTDRKS